jgi:hypothetical protein
MFRDVYRRACFRFMMCKGRGQLFKEAYDAARGRKLALALRDSIAAGARNKFAFAAINQEK